MTYQAYVPADEQVEQILLESTRSGRLSRDGAEILAAYIRTLRMKGSRPGHSNTSKD